jgi:hypothetical protein
MAARFITPRPDRGLMIGDVFAPALEGRRFATRDASTGAVPASLAPREGGRPLWRLAEMLERHVGAPHDLGALDNGMPLPGGQVGDSALPVVGYRPSVSGRETGEQGPPLHLELKTVTARMD